MSLFRRFVSFLARSRVSAPHLSEADDTEPVESELPDLRAAEEFQKIHRGLRRLSLASDRSGEMLQAVAARVDELHQSLLRMNRQGQVALTLEEAELLRLLDQLDRAAYVPSLPPVAGASIDRVRATLLATAGWQPVAQAGGRPDGVDIRIAEFLGDGHANGSAGARIHRILEQGYRRADGTLLRSGVVIAASATEAERQSAVNTQSDSERAS